MRALKPLCSILLLISATVSVPVTHHQEISEDHLLIGDYFKHDDPNIDTFPYHLHTRASLNGFEEDGFHVPHLQAITNGVTAIDGFNTYASYVALFGKNIFPVATDEKHIVMAAALHGKGRVLIAGHEGFVLSGNKDPGLTQLTQNAVQWLAQADSLDGIKLASWAGTVGDLPGQIGVTVANLDPAETQVYYIPMRAMITEEEAKKLVTFVENGGGLIVAGQIWAWYNSHGSENIVALDHPGNRLIKTFGAVMGINVRGAKSLRTSLEMNLYYALESILKVDSTGTVSEDAMRSINLYTNIVFTETTHQDKDFQDIFQLALYVFENMPANIDKAIYSKLVNKLLQFVLLDNPESIKKASDADQFPGMVPEGSEKVTKTFTVNGTYVGYPRGFPYAGSGSPLWVSTGLYAVAGDVIKIQIDADDYSKLPTDHKLDVQIGCHTDQLYKLENPIRSPQIVTTSRIYGVESIAANPWGGLVYVRVPHGAQYPMFKVTISNVVNAPYFVLGKTNAEEWKSTLRNYPAPWGELEIEGQFVFSFQSSELKKYDDPDSFLLFYKNIMKEYNFMQGFRGDYRFRAERYAADIKISGGWLHSGYPVMGYMTQVPGILNTSMSMAGKNWGLYHEIGHNAQLGAYTTGATTESGCNVYAHHIHLNVFNESARFTQERTDSELLNFVLGGRKNYGGHTAVLSYTLLLDMYGSEHWRNMNIFYLDHPDQIGKDKYDSFAWVMTNVMKMNLCPFYEFFAYSLSERTLENCKNYPDLPDLIVDRYFQALYPPEVEHGKCQAGWIPYGQSCFSIVEGESLTWKEAEKACAQKDSTSHLASCLTQQESYFLSRHQRENDIQSFLFMGISENNEQDEPQFLNGDQVPELFPWKSGFPNKDKNKCTGMEKGVMSDVHCNNKFGYICKSGPTSCGPKN